MIVVGLTGNFGSGKSLATKCFGDLGVAVCDTDKVVKDLWGKSNVIKKAQQILGKDIYCNKILHREKIAQIIFSNDRKRKQIEKFIHPLVKKEVEAQLKKWRKQGVTLAIIEVPLLVEVGWTFFDYIIVVKANQQLQINRIQKRMAISKSGILKRLKTQMPIREKLKYADFVIDNRGSKIETKKQVKKIFKDLINKTQGEK